MNILPDEVEVRIEAHEGFTAAAEGAYVAALDTDVTEDLRLEGLAREFVRRVQDLRKQADLQVDDRIHLQVAASDQLTRAIDAHRAYIAGETLADKLEQVAQPEGEAAEEYRFENETLLVALRRAEG